MSPPAKLCGILKFQDLPQEPFRHQGSPSHIKPVDHGRNINIV